MIYQIEHAVTLGAQDDTLEVRLVPVILGSILDEILLQTNGVLGCGLPHAAVADLKQQHAIAVLVEQVAVLGVGLDQLAGIVVNQRLLGNGVNLRHEEFLGLSDVGNLNRGIQQGHELRHCCRLLFAIVEQRRR